MDPLVNQTDSQSNQGADQLQQRIQELEGRVAELEAELVKRPPQSRQPFDWRKLLKPLLLLALTLLLAALPALLIVQNRWLDSPAAVYYFQNFWCKATTLCTSAFPSYFALIFPALAGLIALVALQQTRRPLVNRFPAFEDAAPPSSFSGRQKKVGAICLWGASVILLFLGTMALVTQKLPDGKYALAFLVFLLGWFLLETPLASLVESWRANWVWIASLLLAFTCLVLLIASLYAVPEFQWIQVVLIVFASLLLGINRRKIPPIVWVMALALVLFSYNLNAWWTAAIGDEYSFFVQARNILQEGGLAKVSEQLFLGQAVNGTHPYFSSLVHAAFMGLLGINGFAWRFSNAVLCAASVGFFYLFFKLLVPRQTALMASIFLAASHYLISFGRIGYNNLQALFGMGLVMAAAAWAVLSKRRLAFSLVGAALGVCFYLYPAGLYIIPLPFLLFLFCYPPKTWRAAQDWLLVVLALFILVFPLLLQPAYWQTKVFGTFFNNPALVQNLQVFLTHITRNFFYAFFSFLYITSEGHFVAASYVDPLVGALACLGMAWLVTRAFRERTAAFLLLSLLLLILTVGASHDRDFPPNTRMFLLLPWWTLMAGIGLAWILDRLGAMGLAAASLKAIPVGVAAAVILLNLYMGNALDRDRMAGLQNLENLFLRIVQKAQDEEARFPKAYFFLTDQGWSSEGIRLIMQTYPVKAQITDVLVNGEELPETIRGQIYQKNSLVVIKPWLDPTLTVYYEQELRELGKFPCEIKATNGDQRFVLWYSTEAAALCR